MGWFMASIPYFSGLIVAGSDDRNITLLMAFKYDTGEAQALLLNQT